ncbi:MAG: EpsG family protein [Oscillospiraceae bacterium]|jgi:hypothetical protein|nr:EpsG family protein [Oscillospiraceae bacterium]
MFVEKYGSELKLKYNNKNTFMFVVAAVSLPIFFIGFRSTYADTGAYVYGYENIKYTFDNIPEIFEDSKGPIFEMYQMFLNQVLHIVDYHWFLFITAVITTISFFRFFYRYSVNFTFTLFLFYGSFYFFTLMNGIRQAFATALIMFFFDWVLEKKTIRFLIVVLIAFYIHNSAIIWFAMYFVVGGKPWSKKILLSLGAILFFVFFSSAFTDLLDSALEETNYAGYTDQFSQDDGVNPINVLVSAVPVILSLWKKKEIEEKATPFINLCINASLMGFAVFLLGAVTSGVLIGRMIYFFNIFNFVLIPWIIENAFEGKDKTTIKLFCYGGYSLYFYLLSTALTKEEYISIFLNLVI